MHLPRPLYNAVPAIYIVCAVVSMMLIETPYSLISACLFTCASWMVWRMRKDARDPSNMRTARVDSQELSD